jgi:hypothetical protein
VLLHCILTLKKGEHVVWKKLVMCCAILNIAASEQQLLLPKNNQNRALSRAFGKALQSAAQINAQLVRLTQEGGTVVARTSQASAVTVALENLARASQEALPLLAEMSTKPPAQPRRILSGALAGTDRIDSPVNGQDDDEKDQDVGCFGCFSCFRR